MAIKNPTTIYCGWAIKINFLFVLSAETNLTDLNKRSIPKSAHHNNSPKSPLSDQRRNNILPLPRPLKQPLNCLRLSSRKPLSGSIVQKYQKPAPLSQGPCPLVLSNS